MTEIEVRINETKKAIERLFGKPLNKLTEEDAINRAIEFELDKVTPEEFFAMEKEARRDYAQRVIDFFYITATQFVVGVLAPEDDNMLQRYQGRISDLGVNVSRIRRKKPTEIAEAFKICDEAFEQWLNREPEISPEPVEPTLSELFHLEHSFLWTESSPIRLINPEFGLERNAYTIAGNVDGFFTQKQIDDVVRFCPVKWVSYEELGSLPPQIQKRYFATLSAFFKTTWADILEHWFMNTVPVSEFTTHIRALDIHSSHILNSRNITDVIDKCAEHERDLIFEENLPEDFPEIPDIPEIPARTDVESIEAALTKEVVPPPVAESEYVLTPTGEIILDRNLKQEAPRPKLMFGVLLEANLPLEAFNELASIVEKYGNGENIYSFSAQFLGASLT